MRFFFIIAILAALISCGRKQEKEKVAPTRQNTKPDYEDVDLPETYVENLRKWEESFEKECSISHIFRQEILHDYKYDYLVAIDAFKSFLNASTDLEKEKSSIFIPHPNWEELALDDDYFYQEERIKRTPVSARLKDGVCEVFVNGKSILKHQLLKTIPILYSFDETKIKGNTSYSPVYQFQDFKNLKMAKNTLLEDPFFNNIENLIRKERLLYQTRADGFCPRSRSLFTLLRDDSKSIGYRCLFRKHPFNLNTIGINNQGEFLYQIERSFKINEYAINLKINDYEKNEDVTEFEEKYWPHLYQIFENKSIEYSLRAINNCHLIVSVKKEHLNKIESYDLLLTSNRSDFSLEGQRNNNLIIAKLEDINENLVIRFNSFKKAKKIFNKLLSLKYRCQ